MRSSAHMQPQALQSEMISSAAWLVCLGAPDPDLLDRLAGGTQPVLLVVTTEAQAQELLDAWGRQRWPERWELQVQLVGAESGECTWFRYNDPRCDGVVPLEPLRLQYPNLQLEGMELRPQTSLNALLEAWEPAAADGGVVWLGSAPDDLLASLSREVALRLQGVVGQGGAANPDLQARLRMASLVPGSGEPVSVWRRDPVLHLEHTLLVERDGLQTRVEELEQRLTAINTELDSILALLDS